MSDSNANSCETCLHWKRLDSCDLTEDEQGALMSDEVDNLVMAGECKRFPPSLLPIKREATYQKQKWHILEASLWPITWQFDVCGEYRKKP